MHKSLRKGALGRCEKGKTGVGKRVKKEETGGGWS